MAVSNKVRNRIVGALIIVSIMLILLPAMMLDRPAPEEKLDENPIAVDKNGAITDANGLLASQGPDYSTLLDPVDDLASEEVLKAQPKPDVNQGNVEVLDLPEDGPFAVLDNKEVVNNKPDVKEKEEVLVAKKADNTQPKNNNRETQTREKTPSKTNTANSNNVNGKYTVQVGVFSQDANAQKVVNQLKTAGINARMEKVTVNGRNLNRVYAGSSNNRNDMQKLLPTIEKLTGAKGRVVSIK